MITVRTECGTRLWAKQRRWLSGRVPRRKSEPKKESCLIQGHLSGAVFFIIAQNLDKKKDWRRLRKEKIASFCVCEINSVCKLN